MSSWPVPWLTRVRVTRYKSILECDVKLRPLTILVGPNGAGKSNFLDAIRFLSEAVATTPYQAVESRGGFGEILNRTRRLTAFTITINAVVPWDDLPEQWATGEYSLTVGPRRERGRRPIEVLREHCVLRWNDVKEEFAVEGGKVAASGLPLASERIEPDRLLLPLLGSLPNFAPLAGALERMEFYRLDPSSIRQPQPEVEAAILGPHGEHLADVLGALDTDHPDVKQRVDAYLSAVVPGLDGVGRNYVRGYVTVAMRQRIANGRVEFGPDAMSDGTVRAAAVLAALFQPSTLTGGTSLVAIEEPELALHPAATGVLYDAMSEASEHVQVIATSHSADLLDREDVDPGAVRAVTLLEGRTLIGELDEASQRIVAEKRLTLGELMRGNQLAPRRTA